jgi:hypothetical protein
LNGVGAFSFGEVRRDGRLLGIPTIAGIVHRTIVDLVTIVEGRNSRKRHFRILTLIARRNGKGHRFKFKKHRFITVSRPFELPFFHRISPSGTDIEMSESSALLSLPSRPAERADNAPGPRQNEEHGGLRRMGDGAAGVKAGHPSGGAKRDRHERPSHGHRVSHATIRIHWANRTFVYSFMKLQ